MSDFQLTEAQTGVDGNILRLIDPAEIPTPGGDAESLEQAAADLRSGGEEILELAEGAGSTWSGLDAHYEAPESGELLAAMDPTVEKAEGVESDLTTVADALDDFAAAIRTAKNSLNSLRAQAEELRSEVDADSAIWWLKKPSAITENMDLKDAVNRAWQTYNDAEIECANTISGLSDGPTYVAPDEYTGAPEEIPYGLATDAGEQDRGFTDFAGRYFGDSYEWMREGDDAPWPVDWYLGFQLGALETVVVDVGWETGVTVVSLSGLWGPNTGWTLKPNEIMQNKVEFGQGAVEGTAALVGLHGEDGWLINPFGGEPYWGYDWDAQRDNAGAAWSEQREAFFAWSEWGENNEYAAGVTTTNIALLPVSGTLRAVRTLLGGGRRGGADGPDGGREDVDSDADGFASLDPEGGPDGQFESVDELLENLDEDPIPDGRVEDLMPDLDTGSVGGPTPRLPTPNPDPDPIPDPTPSPNPRPSVDEPRQDGTRPDRESQPQHDADEPNAPVRESGDPDTPATPDRDPQGGDTGQPRTERTSEQQSQARDDDDTFDDQVDDGLGRRDENKRESEPVRPREESADTEPSSDGSGDGGDGRDDGGPVAPDDQGQGNDNGQGSGSPDATGKGGDGIQGVDGTTTVDSVPSLLPDPTATYPGHVDSDGIRRFSSNGEGQDYGDRVLGYQFDNLTSEQQLASRSYTQKSYYYNTFSRMSDKDAAVDYLIGLPPPYFRDWLHEWFGGPDPTPANAAEVRRVLEENLDAFDAATRNPLPEAVQIHRGLRDIDFMLDPVRGIHDPSDLIGEDFIERGYMSGSLGVEAAFGPPSHRYQLHIDVPRGYDALWMGRNSLYPNQREIILSRGTRLVFTDAVENPTTGVWDITVRVESA
ncbi:hypothetical protein KIK06_09430 [Nocardiopsis sp. EMB25]|uniref:ADP-ribosyltransferase n=1 Tax=Nocardiopsis sp. EMB25 TaxID=2835867 RepID=UPI0022845072|nr:ADP-ribosyltransferase [Nocardiopsis sp. EMB25]MCY9784113.1 hypothetical protein [Nocardiopsis sp. EMB25]